MLLRQNVLEYTKSYHTNAKNNMRLYSSHHHSDGLSYFMGHHRNHYKRYYCSDKDNNRHGEDNATESCKRHYHRHRYHRDH